VGRRRTAIASSRGRRTRHGEPQLYDFRRPNKFTRDHARALEIVGETFSRQFSTMLGTTLRAISNVAFAGVDTLTYDEYVRRLSNPSYLAVMSLTPLGGAALYHIETPITMAIIERLLGGSGSSSFPIRPLTQIEEQLIRNVVERSLREFEYAFEPLSRLEAKIVQQESNPQFAHIAAPSDMTVVMALEIRIGDLEGLSSICIPLSVLQPVLDEFSNHSLFADRDPHERANFAHQLEHALLAVPVPVSVRFDPVALASTEVVELTVGDVVALEHSIHEPLTVMVGDRPAFKAMAGRSGKKLGCVIVEEKDPVRWP
jgi:flagellar motor switch protein FliM